MARASRIQGLVMVITIELCLATAAAEILQKTTIGVLLPYTSRTTLKRKYEKRLRDAIESLIKPRLRTLNFNTKFRKLFAALQELSSNPTPMQTLDVLCGILDNNNVIAILYMTDTETYGKTAASAQYLLQLTGFLGIPVIAWVEDNIGLHQTQRISESMVLQLAPSVEHQLDAMLSILKRYSWHQFSVVTSQVSGHDDFVRAVRDRVIASTDFTFNILDIFTLKRRKREDVAIELETLAKSEARVILLYCTRDEAAEIMAAANDLKITGKHYIWIVTQAVIDGVIQFGPSSFPPGMLGVHFNASVERIQDEIERAVTVLIHGLELYVNDPHNANISLSSHLACNRTGDAMWTNGARFFKYLRSVNSKKRGQPVLRFNPDGTLTDTELEIMNLNKLRFWDKVGFWTQKGLIIKDIVWPGGSTTPPAGLPEKFNLKVTFMDEPPYVNIAPPDEETGECKTQRAVKCTTKPIADVIGFNNTSGSKIYNHYNCCAGFCIDLLQKFANDIGFTYDLYKVEDGKWGAYHNGTWNGLIAELLNHKADIVVTSIKINSERQSAVDFTVPFLETGIAIVVAKRTGIISPKAFLEPFDTISWIMILLICIQLSAIAIFLFEWLSPSGYNMHTMPPRDHKFSLFRTYWLVWAILFGAAVNVDCPRGYTARFMSNVWAMFAVVFLAIYTANLAAFMITREEYYDLTGIEDKLLKYPTMLDPPFSYGTIPHGNTEAVLKKNKPELYRYMKKHNRPSVKEGIKAVKTGNLHAFIYDSTVLEYWVGQDNECRLLTVGSWYAMTGYGFALPKNSKYLNMFNSEMIKYRENGDLERLQRFWLQGACKPTKNKRHVSKPLDINQFMSAFLLLGCGVLLTILVLGLEHLYFRYVRKHLPKKDKGGIFTLISMSIGKSLSFGGAVFEAQDIVKHHRCKDPICDTQLWKTRHELDMAHLKIRQLEAEIEKRSSGDRYFHPHDITRYGGISDSCLPAPPRYIFCRTPSTTEVAEIETVL